MKNKKPFITWLNTGIFHGNIMFSVGFSYEEINKNLTKLKAWNWKLGISKDKEFIESGKNFAMKRTIYKKATNENNKILFYVIFTDNFTFNDWHYCKLAHEVLHICQFMLPDFLDRNKEIEAEAYLHTHIMTQCLNSLRKK